MKRFFLFVALSLFYTSAMIVVGGYNVSTDAAQLWNSQRGSNDKSSGSSYYNSQRSSNSGKQNLFNGQGTGIQRQGLRDRMAYDYLQYENRQRSRNRTPAVFQYMSPYAVANRLDDIDNALKLQSERRKEVAKLLKRSRDEAEKFDFRAFKKRNREKLRSRMASSMRYGKTQSKKRSAGKKNGGVDGRSSYTSSSGGSVGTPSSVQLFNTRGSSNSDGGGKQKTTLFNSSN